MVAFNLNSFAGMIPAMADELLPPNAAAHSQNAWLYSGQLVGLPLPKALLGTALELLANKIFRIPTSYDQADYIYGSIWVQFPYIDTDFIRAPVFNDIYDRYYWAPTPDGPRYNTRARIEGDGPSWLLGINPPAVAPTLVADGGSKRGPDVRVATTTAGVLSTSYVTGKVIDGVTLKLNDRILLKDGVSVSGKIVNGVRVVHDGVGTPPTATPPRATDMDNPTEFVGKYFKILEGNAYAGTFWKVTNTTDPVLGTDEILFEEIPEIPVQVTRAYVTTWVTEYGEESAPSPPVVVTGAQDATWKLTNLAVPTPLDQFATSGAVRAITKTRIYRTITSTAGVATFFLVDEVPCTQTTYDDDKTDDDVSQKPQLESFSWTPPPADLKGLTSMWNGMVAGFRENELWICEPYRPHAWPAHHTLTLDYPIVGLGVSNQTLVACTSVNPVNVNGSMPENLGTTKIAKFEPCVSRASILSSPNGVIYASPNGLILCSHGGAENITKDLITRDKWKEYTHEARLKAAWLGSAYYAFGSVVPGTFQLDAWQNDMIQTEDFTGAYNGIFIDPTNSHVSFNLLKSEIPIVNVYNDLWSGDVLILRLDDLYWLDMGDKEQPREVSLWKSRIFQTNDARNMGAMKVFFKPTPGLPALNPVRNVDLIQTLASDQWGLCRVYADGELKLTREIRKSGELWKLPSGFLADFWQYEVETRLKIVSVQFGSSAKELAGV